MLTDKEIEDYANKKTRHILGSICDIDPATADWFKKGLYLGYSQSQAKTPTDSIGFAEWINRNFYYQVSGREWYLSEGPAEPIAKNSEELYSIYLESLKQQP